MLRLKTNKVLIISLVIMLAGFDITISNAEENSTPVKSTIELNTFVENKIDSTNYTALNFSNNFPNEQWWKSFNDPVLDGYIDKALLNNNNLKIAAARIEENRALAREMLGLELPILAFQPGFERQKNPKNLTSPTIKQFTQTGPRLFAPGSTVNIYQVPLIASYETDFWQVKRKKTRAQEKLIDVATEELKTMKLLIAGEVSTAYINLLSADKLIELQQELIFTLNLQLKLVEDNYNNGLINYQNVLSIKEQIEQAEATINQYKIQQRVAIHQILALMGDTTAQSDDLERSSFDRIKFNTEIPAGIPSDIIIHRPDILAREAQLESSKIQVSIARRSFIPNLFLTGQFGFASTNLKNLFSLDSILTSFASTLSHTIFTGGAKMARLKVQKHRYDQDLYNYYQTILTAFQEIEDSLATLRYDYNELNSLERRLSLLQDSKCLTESQYNIGLISYIDVLEPDIDIIMAKQSIVISKSSVLIDKISLYKALGGGY